MTLLSGAPTPRVRQVYARCQAQLLRPTHVSSPQAELEASAHAITAMRASALTLSAKAASGAGQACAAASMADGGRNASMQRTEIAWKFTSHMVAAMPACRPTWRVRTRSERGQGLPADAQKTNRRRGGSRVRTSAMIGISLSEAVYGVANSMAGARNSVIW